MRIFSQVATRWNGVSQSTALMWLTPFTLILVAPMHTVDAEIAQHPIRLRRATLADMHACWPRLGPVLPCALVRGPAPQVGQAGSRNLRQPFEAGIRKHQESPFHQLLGGQARHGTMPRIHVGRRGHVRGGESAEKAVPGWAGSVRQHPVLAILPHQPGHLLT